MGLYKRSDSRFWWMSYTAERQRLFQSTKTSSKEIAMRILKHREGEIALGLFKVGWPGERKTFAELCDEFSLSHSSTLARGTRRNHEMYDRTLRAYFGKRQLTELQQGMIEKYRDHRRSQPSRRNPKKTVKGATVNRELEFLQCMFEYAVGHKYIAENPAAAVKHFNERRERPGKRMLPVEEEHRILEAAPPHLRVGIVLLVQTGGRTYSEGFSLRWDQVDFDGLVIHPGNDVKTDASQEPIPLTRLACDVLQEWRKEQGTGSPFVFPSPHNSGKPLGTVKTAWKATLRRAGVPYFPIYNLRHVFCTRLSWVAPDAVVQRAMRHSSPETKRHYQLGMADQVREHLERVNEKAYQGRELLRFRDSSRSEDNRQPVERQ